MKSKTLFINASAAIVLSAGITSCSGKDISGTWAGQTSRLDNVPSAATASALNTFDFSPVDKQTKQGDVNISSLINVTQAVQPIQSTLSYPYEVNIAATATISGKYVFEKDDDDDILITFDPASMNVVVDPDGVSFSQNLLSGLEQPELDSLTQATIASWKAELSRAMLINFNRFSKISDIEIHHGNTLTCEVDDHDLTFSKVSAE